MNQDRKEKRLSGLNDNNDQPLTVETLPQTQGSVLCLRFRGHIAGKDFIEHCTLPLEKIVAQYQHYSLYIEYHPDFQGWDLDAADANFKCISSLVHNLRRAAYVNAPDSRYLLAKMMTPMTSGEFRFFDEGQQEEALTWILEQKN